MIVWLVYTVKRRNPVESGRRISYIGETSPRRDDFPEAVRAQDFYGRGTRAKRGGGSGAYHGRRDNGSAATGRLLAPRRARGVQAGQPRQSARSQSRWRMALRARRDQPLDRTAPARLYRTAAQRSGSRRYRGA